MARVRSGFGNIKFFTKKTLRKYSHSSGPLVNKTQRDLTYAAVNNDETSFRREDYPNGLKSTQQLPNDNSKFFNNTFFGSAEVKVNVAFDKIINKYPFDSPYDELERFEDSLSSFEKHILGEFPKHTGFIRLNSNNNQYITVKDKEGYLNPNLSKNISGKNHLNPKDNSFSLEFFVRLPPESNKNSFIFHSARADSIGGRVGYAAFLKETDSTSNAEIGFIIMSGSRHQVISSSFSKNEWHNLNFIYDKSSSQQTIRIQSASVIIKESNSFNFGSLDSTGINLDIGFGENITENFRFSLDENNPTFNGYLDEFRLFHGLRREKEIDYYSKRNIFSYENLKLNFRFNEPSGSYKNNDIVLDYSGNSFHSKIVNFIDDNVRDNFENGVLNPVSLENKMFNPILFPSFPDVVNLNSDLLEEATDYDNNNPNMITKLVPPHLLEDAAYFDGVSVEGDIVELYDGSLNLPRNGKLGSSQLMSLFLYFMAEELDAYKMYLDQASQFVFPDYQNLEGVSNVFLKDLASYYGVNLPDIFGNASFEQFLGSENLGLEFATYEKNLSQIQNLIYRRILKNINFIFKSKGTKEAIKYLFRSSGIEPDRLFRLVEYNGINEFRLGSSRQNVTEMSTMLNFSGSLTKKVVESKKVSGLLEDRPTLLSAPLSGSRIEPGIPDISGGNVLASGSIKFHSTDLGQNPVDGTTLTLTDAYGESKVFEFDTNSNTTAGNIPVNISNMSTTGSMDVLIATITGSMPNSFNISKRRSQPGHNIDIIDISTKDFSRKNLGNHNMSTNATPDKLVVYGFSNGNGFINAGNIGYENAGISATSKDGLLTSGSWTVEGVYQFPSSIDREVKRSLSRLIMSGTNPENNWYEKFAVTSNLVMSDTGDSLTLYVRNSNSSNAPLIEVVMTGSDVQLLNGQKWYISYGRKRDDLIGTHLSSSYFIKAASYNHNKVSSFITTEKAFYEGEPTLNVFQNSNPAGGVTWSPQHIIIGSQSFENGATQQFLNDTVTSDSVIPLSSKTSYFDGKISNLRFWSKALSDSEALEHARNFKSVAVDDPTINNTFSTTRSGSFERLRLNITTDQINKNTDSLGKLDLIDFSQNHVKENLQLILSGATLSLSGAQCFGFEKNKTIIQNQRYDFSIISPFFDEYLENENVKVAGFTEGKNVKLYNTRQAPVSFIPRNELEVNDNRFEIQIHLQRGLDEDIMNIFSSIEALDKALGDPNLLFAQEYPNIRAMRDLYFNRLTDKVNYRNFFDLFRWIDDAFSGMVHSFVPKNVDFLGINLIIESHALERYKVQYRHHDIYNDEDTRGDLRSVLLVSQRSGVIKRF